jgi:hypothetical protein
MFLHASNDGFKLDANHDQPIEADDLPGLIAAFNSRGELWADWQARDAAKPWTENWWFAEADAIEHEDWNLSASRYRPESRETAEHRDPRELLEELQEDVAAILGDIEALAAELGECLAFGRAVPLAGARKRRLTPLFVRFIRARLRMQWLPAGRGYGWLRAWALSGVIVCQLVVDIAAPVFRTRCCGGLLRPRREP